MKLILKFYFIISFALISLQARAQIPNVTSGFIGNTFINGFADDDKWVQNYAEELDVASDGTMITASLWDEAGRCVGIFKDGQPVAYIKQDNPTNACWGYGTGTNATAVDDNYLYVNNCEGLMQRYNRATGYSYIDAINTGVAEGMTVSGSFVYMITPAGLVQKRSASNLDSVSLSFTVTGGYDLAVDYGGNIWVLTSNKEVIKYTSDGDNTGIKITGQSDWLPSAVNFDDFNDLLLVPDNGPRRQVIKFNLSGEQVGTFGDLGGISAGTKGFVGDLRFWNISGCGTDANGNIYVALSEDCVSLRKFNSAGVKQWEVLGTMFTDITSIDPDSDGNDIYSVNEHMKFDYSTQQWSLISKTVDRINYPNDRRNGGTGTEITSALMRRVNGNLIMFTAGMFVDKNGWDVYRFDGEIAVHTKAFTGLGWSALPDKNGNMWYESAGRIKKIPLTGFSGRNPVFGAAVDVTRTLPSPMISIERLEYDLDKDVMYIGGWTTANPNTANNWGLVGSTLASYPNWSTGNRTVSNSVVLNLDAENYFPKAMSVADDYIFVGGSRDRGELSVYNSSDLSSVGFIAPPLPDIGWLDIPHAVQAFKKSNGQYVILVEDNYAGKNIVYQWCPMGDCEVTLPLKLVSFNANLTDGKPNLQWQTENEVNVSHFEIERSSDGNRFDKINEIASRGGSNYNTIDEAPKKGYNYYRLKMVDKDGRFSYSNVEIVKVLNDNMVNFSISPNPAKDHFKIVLSSQNTIANITVINQLGNKILSKQITGNTSISIGHLPGGVYIVQLMYNGEIKITKMIKE